MLKKNYIAMKPFLFIHSVNGLKKKAEQLKITGYNQKELVQASKAYATQEKIIRQQKAGDAVLVSVESLGDLRRAYPNYFADTAIFMEILDECMKE